MYHLRYTDKKFQKTFYVMLKLWTPLLKDSLKLSCS
ncbi:unnamed protein product [Larinioides sclopetarius]|uniref:Uncharacterized protein n=1 Tax=Larinioides sclopetarius TaxID=280406 RepID=A0AAV2BIP8_9ARAC